MESTTEFVRVTNQRPGVNAGPLYGPAFLVFSKGEDGNTRIPSGQETGIILHPGGNNIAREAWEASKKNPTVKSWIDLGWVSEGGDTAAPEGAAPPDSLNTYSTTTALSLIEVEDSPHTLKLWEAQEQKHQQRPDVLKKIRAKLGASDKAAKK